MTCTVCKRDLRSVVGTPPVCGNARCLGEIARRRKNDA